MLYSEFSPAVQDLLGFERRYDRQPDTLRSTDLERRRRQGDILRNLSSIQVRFGLFKGNKHYMLIQTRSQILKPFHTILKQKILL
jgi:hypothetical protein